MLRSLSLSFGALGVALALTACAGEIDEKPAATVEAPAPEAPATPETPAANPAEGADAVAVDAANSTIHFLGAKVTKTHAGGFNDFTGELLVKDGEAVGTKFTIKLGSVFSDAEKLTGHLMSPDFFDVEKFAEASFKSTEIQAGGADGATHTVKGELDLHGVKKVISFPATITMGEDAATAKAEFKINRKDFGIVYPGKPDDLIKDDVGISLDLKFPMSKAAAAPGGPKGPQGPAGVADPKTPVSPGKKMLSGPTTKKAVGPAPAKKGAPGASEAPPKKK